MQKLYHVSISFYCLQVLLDVVIMISLAIHYIIVVAKVAFRLNISVICALVMNSLICNLIPLIKCTKHLTGFRSFGASITQFYTVCT